MGLAQYCQIFIIWVVGTHENGILIKSTFHNRKIFSNSTQDINFDYPAPWGKLSRVNYPMGVVRNEIVTFS